MKIKNLKESLLEAKKLVEAEDINSLDGSTAEAVADVIEGGKEAGKEISKEAAEQEVAEAKRTVSQFNLNPYAATAKLSDVEECLQQALEAVVLDRDSNQDNDYPNVLIYGLPGFGKTAGVKKFCREHGIYMLALDAKTLRKEELAGLPYKTTDKDGNEVQGALPTKTFLDLKKHDKVILVLDELNRARTDIEGTLLGLINDHDLPLPGYDSTGAWQTSTHFDNILFTVGMINPASRELFPDAHELDPAMSSRFFTRVEAKADKKAFLRVLKGIYTKILNIATLSPESKKRYQGQLNIAEALLTNKNFKFDGKDEAVAAHKSQRNGDLSHNVALSYRVLLGLLRLCDGTKASFLRRLKFVGLLDTTKLMIENCLATYTDKNDKANSVFQQAAPAAAKKYEQSTQAEIDAAMSAFAADLD